MFCRNWYSDGGKMRWPRIIASVIGGIIIVVAFTAAFGIIAQMLWNWLMPSLFGLREITYYEAFGIMILARLLIGGFGHRRHYGRYQGDWMRRKQAHKSWHHHDYKDWQHYDTWWSEEGKEAFQKFAESRNKEKNGGAH